jgi:hypothetical protein
MNETAIQEIAKQIVQQQLHYSWPYVLGLIALSAIFGALSNYGVSFFRKRGETRALKADLEEILRQSKVITLGTEEVKVAISQNAWASREARTIRRAKLEDLILSVDELQEWLTKRRNCIVHGVELDPGPSPLKRAVVLAQLYFPELIVEVKKLHNVQLRYDAYQLETSSKIKVVGEDLQARALILNSSSEKSRELYGEYLEAANELSYISRSLMQKILGT